MTAPTIDTNPLEQLDLRPPCCTEDCDEPPVWGFLFYCTTCQHLQPVYCDQHGKEWAERFSAMPVGIHSVCESFITVLRFWRLS